MNCGGMFDTHSQPHRNTHHPNVDHNLCSLTSPFGMLFVSQASPRSRCPAWHRHGKQMPDHTTTNNGPTPPVLLLTTVFLSYLQTIESDFYATEAGRAHFSDQLTSIRYW
jgi:hypothetical protein